MNRMLRYLFAVGMGLFFCYATLFYKPSISYARGCGIIPPWKYHISILFENDSSRPFTISDGNYMLGSSSPPILTNPTNRPVYLIPTAILTANLPLEQIIIYTDTIKFINGKTYYLEQSTHAWTEVFPYDHSISSKFLSIMPIPYRYLACPQEQPLNDPNFPPPPIHDTLTVVYDDQLIKIPGTMQYIENPNYSKENREYFFDRNGLLFLFLALGCGGILVLFGILYIGVRLFTRA